MGVIVAALAEVSSLLFWGAATDVRIAVTTTFDNEEKRIPSLTAFLDRTVLLAQMGSGCTSRAGRRLSDKSRRRSFVIRSKRSLVKAASVRLVARCVLSMNRRSTREADAQRVIMQAMRFALPRGATHQAILAGMGVHPGFVDLIVISGGRDLFLEVKSQTGRLRKSQEVFGDTVVTQGFGWALVRSVDDALGALADNGFTSRVQAPSTEDCAMSHKASLWAIEQRD